MSKKNPQRIKTDAVDHAVPQTREEASAAIATIGAHQRERDRIQAAMNDELSVVRERFEAQAKPHNEVIASLTRGVHLFCEAHREALTRGGKTKTHAFDSGEVKWRMRPPSVTVRGKDAVLEALQASRRFARFVRIKAEVNKDAILADPMAVAEIKGISIRQKEDFVVEPWSTELEEVA